MQINPWVRHDRLDDAVMVIDLETGSYYTFEDAAADCWTLLADGAELAVTAEIIVGRYDVDAAEVAADVDAFAASLVEHGLLMGDLPPTVPGTLLPPLEVRRPYRRPELERFDELADVLLLDPIHEVDEAAGWPVPRTG